MHVMSTSEFAADFKKLMDMWNCMEQIVAREYPDLTDDERYEVTKRAMTARLNLTALPI
jgi:hypothetical protein